VVLVKPPPVVGRQNQDLHEVDDNPRRNDCLWAALAPVLARPGVRSIDLAAHVCGDDSSCGRLGPDDDTRYDSVHFTAEAAEDIARWLVPQLVQAVPR
jgi:hypothetical protein